MLVVSPAPHIKSSLSTKELMRDVLIALLPAMLISVYMFGISALIITIVAIISCVIFEWLIQIYLLKVNSSICDLSAVLTGVLLAFNLPNNLPVWMVVLGALIAIGVGKMSFGGLGQNPFNPALVGRVFLLISFPVPMTTWPKPLLSRMLMPWNIANMNANSDALTGATPLALMKDGALSEISSLDLLLGNIGGSLGEISAVALILGGIYLLLRRVITWHIPISILATTFAFTTLLHLAGFCVSPSLHLLTGGLMLGAFFMATDYVTSPMTSKGQILFGIGIAVITVVIRCFGGYPEGVSFAILIMNALVPLINRYVKPRRFGVVKK
ncbi:MAG: RnfABCDGE type electron transport complex subunit D [Bacteroidales bacterium]